MDASAIFKKLRFDDSKKALIINAPYEYENLLAGMEYDKSFDSII